MTKYFLECQFYLYMTTNMLSFLRCYLPLTMYTVCVSSNLHKMVCLMLY